MAPRHDFTNVYCLWLALVLTTAAPALTRGAAESGSASFTRTHQTFLPSRTCTTRNLALLLDVDNTVYEEGQHQIEAQIVQRIHAFCAVELNLSAGQAAQRADDLHAKYGSTIEGLVQTEWQQLKQSPQQLGLRLRHFYESVYRDIDCRSLLLSPNREIMAKPSCQMERAEEPDEASPTTLSSSNTQTGYSHGTSSSAGATSHQVAVQQDQVRRILRRASTSKFRNGTSATELHLASNSPRLHIQKVIQAVGLANIPWKGIWTPDFRNNHQEDNDSNHPLYPTKLRPDEFWKGAHFLQSENGDIDIRSTNTTATLIDDSATTLAVIDKQTPIDTVWLQHPLPWANNEKSRSTDNAFPRTLPQALAVALGWLPNDENYRFSDVAYLRAKNMVDQRSIHRGTWIQMTTELCGMLRSSLSAPGQPQQVQIVDVGAGILSMLDLVLNGSLDSNGDSKGTEPRLPSVVSLLQQEGVDLEELHYYAYEPNRNLESECVKVLKSLGFILQVQTNDDQHNLELVFVRRATTNQHYHHHQPQCTVYLRFWDFRQESLQEDREQPTPHLIVGCCFADLLEPYDLVASLMRCFLSMQQLSTAEPSSLSSSMAYSDHHRSTLVYFPITFAGTTQFLPPQPFQQSDERDGMTIPSDTMALAMYSKCLSKNLGHNLDPHRIETAMADYGGICLARFNENGRNAPYLWQTMLYFFGTVAAPELYCDGWDARGWLNRARELRPTIQAVNVDLLFRLPHLGAWNITDVVVRTARDPSLLPKDLNGRDRSSTFDEILFTGPHRVTTVTKTATEKLAPNEIRIQSECSLISSGTELKIFTGSFDDAALDVNIQGMDEERMTYPLAYGYSLVGRVVECGSDVDESLLGQRVFTFAAHASQVVTIQSAVQRVPNGCAALDAIFMPSVETALSLVQDARPMVGETVAVFGQGLIGLLVTAILSQMHTRVSSSGAFGTVTAFDTIPDRLAASAAMGASQALFPSESSLTVPFDVAIEVSGSGAALQAAIDSTRDGGRVIIGSWYGNSNILLKLGIDFHRSHKTLKVSQVSEVAADLSKTWSKDRRFAMTWELLQSIRPSRLLTRRTSLNNAQQVYDSLENGEEIAVAFEYS